jgi:hypothetical protein
MFWNGSVDERGLDWPGPCDLISEGASHMHAYIEVVTDYPEFIENAVVNTRANFSCNHWEAKNEE